MNSCAAIRCREMRLMGVLEVMIVLNTCLVACCCVLVQVREVLQTATGDGDIQCPTSQRACPTSGPTEIM
jgi:hypothetical protein